MVFRVNQRLSDWLAGGPGSVACRGGWLMGGWSGGGGGLAVGFVCFVVSLVLDSFLFLCSGVRP